MTIKKMLILSLCISSAISFSDDTTNPQITKEEVKKMIEDAVKAQTEKILDYKHLF